MYIAANTSTVINADYFYLLKSVSFYAQCKKSHGQEFRIAESS